VRQPHWQKCAFHLALKHQTAVIKVYIRLFVIAVSYLLFGIFESLLQAQRLPLGAVLHLRCQLHNLVPQSLLIHLWTSTQRAPCAFKIRLVAQCSSTVLRMLARRNSAVISTLEWVQVQPDQPAARPIKMTCHMPPPLHTATLVHAYFKGEVPCRCRPAAPTPAPAAAQRPPPSPPGPPAAASPA
jgi:hypothetical protein